MFLSGGWVVGGATYLLRIAITETCKVRTVCVRGKSETMGDCRIYNSLSAISLRKYVIRV